PKILRHAPRLFPWHAVAGRRRLFFRIGIDNVEIGKIDMQFFEPICRAPGCAAAVDWLMTLRRFFNDRTKFLFPASSHVTRSHEHIRLSSHLDVAAAVSGGRSADEDIGSYNTSCLLSVGVVAQFSRPNF